MQIVIVDGYGVGQELARALQFLGVGGVHLRSEAAPGDGGALDPHLYDADLGYVGDAKTAARLLADLAPDGVVPGSARGIAFAEEVAWALGLPANRRAVARRRMLWRSRLSAGGVFTGPLMVVNTVSVGGRHLVSDAWRVALDPQGVQPRLADLRLATSQGRESDAVFGYACAVLHELGVTNGPASTLVRLTDRGPVLVRMDAALMDLPMHAASYATAAMRTQADILAAILAGPEAERARLLAAPRYSARRHLAKLLFNFPASARVRSLLGLRRLTGLRSFVAHPHPLCVGEPVAPSAGLSTQGGIVYLVHDEATQIEADIAQFRLWERRGELYDLEPVEAP
jgi:hypothetical protein